MTRGVIWVQPEGGRLDADGQPRAVGQYLQRAYSDDAGFDLFCKERRTIEPGEFVDIPLGCAVQLPEDWWAMLTGRSSTLRNRGLLVHTAIIDHGYRGPLFAGVFNLSRELVEVLPGERVCQLILMPQWRGRVAFGQLADHPRGFAGFGSSGV